MEFIDFPASGCLVEAVDILGDDSVQLAHFLQAGQHPVGRVGLGVGEEHLIVVEAVKLLGVFAVKAVAQNGFRRIIILLVVQPVHTAEIRNAALGGDAGAAKKDDVIIFFDDLDKAIGFFRHISFLSYF